MKDPKLSNAQYPNYHILRKNKIIKLQQTKAKCEINPKHDAQLIHHVDESTDNHNLDNLLAVCAKCHQALHHRDKVNGVRKTSKYTRLYGATMRELAETTGTYIGKIYEMHYTNQLRPYLENWHKMSDAIKGKKESFEVEVQQAEI